MHNHNSQLAYHVMLYAIQALSEGDFKAIEDLDFTVDEVQQLSQLPVKALKHFARLSSHFLRVKTDHHCFEKMMSHLQHAIEQDALQDDLIRHEAPIAMMTSLFGMSTAEYIQRQKLLGIPPHGAGRPTLLSDEEQETVWQYWCNTEGKTTVERYLAVSRESKHTLRSLWSLIQSWENLNNKQSSTATNHD
ncbi:MAG: DUF2857 domain-containing protein [Thiotrichaceae bacterium]|nr:DUF2857 domain-containing protein [Thiotrichaceae bacterium]